MGERLYTDKTINKLETKIDEYFDICKRDKEPETFSGLAYHLGFCQRHSLNQYAERNDLCSVLVKRAMLRIESEYEKQLRKQSCTGAIFALKNRGWSDKTEEEKTAEMLDGFRAIMEKVMG